MTDSQTTAEIRARLHAQAVSWDETQQTRAVQMARRIQVHADQTWPDWLQLPPGWLHEPDPADSPATDPAAATTKEEMSQP